MGQKSEDIYSNKSSDLRPHARSSRQRPGVERRRSWLEIAVVLALILCAVWTPPGRTNAFCIILAGACIAGFAIRGKWSVSELGLTRPLAGAGYILLAGALLCGAITLIGFPLRSAGPGYIVPLSRSWRAILTAAALFALVHIPSLLLTILAFFGGILFCELFRRFRNLYPLGIIHGALGLTIAASLPDHWLHHMRVGIGYLRLH